nr:integrase, catalytic region, zinc finger, CCHC-type, peptidase aspartic, catalytic [Tanacetum cinerariifolium]
MINRVYYVEGLNHNLFSVGQFCDADLEVSFQKSTCFVRDLQGNDLLTDVDHAGCIDSHKSISGVIQFLGDKLVSWMSKKQNYTVMSSAEAEYAVLSASCTQIGMRCLTLAKLEVLAKESA